MLPRGARSFLAGDAALLGRLGESHIRTVDPKHAAAVYGALEPAQSAVDGLIIANFYSY